MGEILTLSIRSSSNPSSKIATSTVCVATSLPAGVSQKAILDAIVSSDIMIADVSVANPNVMYQIGVRHVASSGPTILISDEPYLPLNTANIAGMIRYSHSVQGFEDLRAKLAAAVIDSTQHEGSHSPIHQLFPELQPTVAKEPCIFRPRAKCALGKGADLS